MPEVDKIRASLTRIEKFARMAAPSANASANEQESATQAILRECKAIVGLLPTSPTKNAAPRPPQTPKKPNPKTVAFERMWLAIVNVPLPVDFGRSVQTFQTQIAQEIIEAALRTVGEKVKAKTIEPAAAFRYFCGICWNRIKEKP